MEEQHSSKPPDDDLKSFEDYSCGLYKDRLLIPGRLYIAKGQVTFQPQFGQVTVIINISDITGLHKKNTAYVFPNAIEIATKPQKYFFGSFYFRDQAFATLQSLLPNQLKLEGEHESNDTEEEPGVNVLSFPNLLDQAKIYLNPSPSHPNPNPSSSSSSSSSNPPNSTLPNSNPSNPSSTELQSRENDTPTKKVHFHDSVTDESQYSSILLDNSSSERRSRAYSANSDDEELKPFASDMPLAAKGLAVFKRMTKSASERSVFDRSNTPPPPATSFSPPPPSSSYSLSANASPAVSPIPQPRYLTDQLDLDHHSDVEQQDNINNNDNNNNNTSVDNISEHTATEGNNENQSSEVSPSISPLHSPHIVTDGEGADISIGQDDHNNSNDSIKNTNNNNNNNNNNNSNNNSPVLPASSSLIPNSAAPPSPSLPKNKPPEPEKLKLPPIVEQCEHMNYSPEGFLLYIDENYPCPIQEFYRIVISNNFWNEVNDVLNYTDVTLTPWLTKTSPAGTPCCLVRQLNFKMELNGKIGPKSTRVQQAQRCRLKNSKELIIETSSVSMDVPYADNFTTDNLLIVKSTNDGASCNLRIACRVNFLKNIWGLGSIIEKNANQGSKDFFALWKELVRAKIEKEYTKQRILASPPPKAASNNQKQPAHRNHPASISPSPLSQSSNSQTQPPSIPSPSPQPSPQLQQPLPSLPPKHTPSKIASHVPQNTSAFTPVSNVAPKKFWPNLQHQMSQLPMPVVALGFVVLLIIAVGLPYVFYLHSRVAFAEAQIVEFNHSAERVNNKIAFMQLYINYLKEHPDSAPPPTPSSPRDDLKSEIAGLAHLLDLASALELRMSAWKVRLDHADTSLRGTQGVVDELRQEMSLILNHADQKMTLGGKIVSDSGNSGWVYFIVSFVLSVLLVAAGMFYFRQSLPGVGGLLDKMKVL